MKKPIVFIYLILFGFAASAQTEKPLTAELKNRYMLTDNADNLEDFSIFVTYGKVGYQRKVNDWLKFGVQGNFLFNWGTDNITQRDAITGSGPIYEGNLWNQRLMSGSSEFALPALFAEMNFGKHTFTVGRFLKNTPVIATESWPFPNAMEGIWYEVKPVDKLKVQLAGIIKMAPRFSGEFEGIGESIGVGAVGVDANGLGSGYRSNTDSDFLGIANVNYVISNALSVDIWNYYISNVSNTFLFEPTFKVSDFTFKSMLILQQRIGDGGNLNPTLQYLTDEKASYFGLRAERKTGKHTLQLNYSRIGDSGRLLLPREWGREPFYTFQRRTRVEGLSDVTSLMAKWQMDWSGEYRDMRLFVTLGSNKTPPVNDFARNKYLVPSAVHLATAFKYAWKSETLKGMSLEMLFAYRFLNEEINGVENYRINRADFFHTDFILTYTF